MFHSKEPGKDSSISAFSVKRDDHGRYFWPGCLEKNAKEMGMSVEWQPGSPQNSRGELLMGAGLLGG